MDWYSIVKFLHVLAAVVWLGGGFAMILIAVRAERSGDDEALIFNLRNTAALGNILFMPASLATLVFGLLMAFLWTGFSDLWIIIGLAGAAATFVTGAGFIKPASDRIAALVAREGATPAVLAEGRRLLDIAKFDYAVMLVIVADMVFKPGPSDYAVLGAMAAAVVLAAVLFLLPRRQTGIVAV